jgi:hypothetical protein
VENAGSTPCNSLPSLLVLLVQTVGGGDHADGF